MLSRTAIRTAARSVVAANAARSINRVVSISVLLMGDLGPAGMHLL
jgi:hypothetical protein